MPVAPAYHRAGVGPAHVRPFLCIPPVSVVRLEPARETWSPRENELHPAARVVALQRCTLLHPALHPLP